MKKIDPEILAHLGWIGFVQPTGLVVSAPALVRAGAILDRQDSEGQRLLRENLGDYALKPSDRKVLDIREFKSFAESVLGWNFSPRGYAGTPENPIPEELEVHLPDYGETLRPDFAVREPDPREGTPPWQLLVQIIETGQDFDRPVSGKGRFEASPHSRMERLLRQTGVTAGLIFNGVAFRLISAPRGESSGWMDFFIADMAQTAGRPIAAALRMLLSQTRLLSLPRDKRLAALLEESRKFQNEVSESLAEQVLHALYELLRGLQAAHETSRGELLREPLAEHPDSIYRSLLTVILRLVFLLYAEERGMLPEDETFLRYYSLAGLHERLREDTALYPDTMDQRYGAWAQLLALFRMIHDGAASGKMKLPKRHGVLFDPDRFPFLEGRNTNTKLQTGERIDPPLVPDGTIYRALEKLLVLDGERISYRALDVEQIGSVYETMMGFRLESATGCSAAIKSPKKGGAPTTVNLEELLNASPGTRAKMLLKMSGKNLSDKAALLLKSAETLEDIHAALLPVIDLDATPDLVPKGAMILQPSEERRRSGSHYTPRSLTEPIVRTTLEPILTRLRGETGQPPRPEAILDLKVCDPAMGSGAFLVEACRQLGDALIESWHFHSQMPTIPPDEDEVIYARRQIAQRCLYGVDKNPVAVDLAKVSLWLATLAKDHPLTFLDHALRHGDSLVGLSLKQLEAFHWDETQPPILKGLGLRDSLDKARQLRREIRMAGEEVSDQKLRNLWEKAQGELNRIRLLGDLALSAFFEGSKPKERAANRERYASQAARGEIEAYRSRIESQRLADPPLVPFHWEIEFPEVFDRENPGFDAIVGNPPFGGHVSVVSSNIDNYTDWLRELHPSSAGKCDLVAHFFRSSFDLIRKDAVFGLIATNTIAQGDTRASGLRWICLHGGEIYCARKRVKWPGRAAVIVSTLHIVKGTYIGARYLDAKSVNSISAFLFHRGGHNDPERLYNNRGKAFVGSVVNGMGFTFDDTDHTGVATPISLMRGLIDDNSSNIKAIYPYIGGEEVNTNPLQKPHRYVINFGDVSEYTCRSKWPELMKIIEEKVKPERLQAAQKSKSSHSRRASIWWQHYHQAKELYSAISGLKRVIVISRVGQNATFTFIPNGIIYAESLIVFPRSTYAALCALQARPHEIWARFFGSSMKDDLRYTPSDCFDTFPFPKDWEYNPTLEAVGKAYYKFRADLMVRNNEGLTKTYNRFHSPDEADPDILKLRQLHSEMDRAVLESYDWGDVPTDCEFLLDYEIDEEEWGRKKKPWRYRWPDEVSEEVLARLIELNAERAKDEAQSGIGRKKTSYRRKVKSQPGQQVMEMGELYQ